MWLVWILIDCKLFLELAAALRDHKVLFLLPEGDCKFFTFGKRVRTLALGNSVSSAYVNLLSLLVPILEHELG